MSVRTVIIGVVASLVLLALIIELVRCRKLRIGYSLLWLFIGVLALALILFRDLAMLLSALMGIRSPGSLLFSAGIAFAILILLEHSLTLTVLWRQDKSLAQDEALLEWRIRQLENDVEELTSGLPLATNTLISHDEELETKSREDVVHATQ